MQNVVVGVIVALAALYVVWKVGKGWLGRKSSCGDCVVGCEKSGEPPLVQIGLPSRPNPPR